MKAYKLLCRRPGHKDCISLWQSIYRGGLVYTYRKWVSPVPGNGPLAVFENLAAVQRFLRLGNGEPLPDNYWLYECEYEPSVHRKLWVQDFRGRSILNEEDLPPGTLLASRVKLTKRVRSLEEPA